MHSIRKFVGRGIIAFSVSVLVVLAVAVQTGQAARLGSALAPASSSLHLQATLSTHLTVPVTVTPQCTAAINDLKAALVKDHAEDATEEANPTDAATDQAEDAAEQAALKPFRDAVFAQCGTSFGAHRSEPPVNATPACTAAWNAAKAAFAADRAEDEAERNSGTAGTAADQAEDQTEIANFRALWASIKSACGSGTQTTTTTRTYSFTWDNWRHRR